MDKIDKQAFEKIKEISLKIPALNFEERADAFAEIVKICNERLENGKNK